MGRLTRVDKQGEVTQVDSYQMNCEQARQLFDAYLDGDLSPSMTAELGAHRVRCGECRRALALMQVSGHILSSNKDSSELPAVFTDRLIACMDAPQSSLMSRAKRFVYIGVPLAAAAVIALAFLGFFNNKETHVAGARDELTIGFDAFEEEFPLPAEGAAQQSGPVSNTSATERQLDEWVQQMQENIEEKRQSGESLHQAFDLTILQLLDILDQAKEGSTGVDHFPGTDDSSGSSQQEDVPPVDTLPNP